MKILFFTITASVGALTAFATAANAAESPTPATSQKKAVTDSTNGHGKNLNFDGDYVETMGKNPMDSLTALSESQKNRNSHLYRKRTEFAPETAETLQQSRFEQ